MRTKYVQCDFGTMAYWDTKLINDEPVIIFIHGNSSSKSAFINQIESPLLKNRYRMLALDLPGHGESDWAEPDKIFYTLSFYTKALLDFLNDLQCKKVVLVGHNLSGHIIIESLTKISNITKIKGMIITGTTIISDQTPPVGDLFLPLGKSPEHPIFMTGTIPKEQALEWAHASFGKNFIAYENFLADIKKSDPKIRVKFGQEWSTNKLNDEIKILQKINRPILMIQGEEDLIINHNQTKSVKIPNLWKNKIESIANCGHTPHCERPEEFNSLIDQFIIDIQ